MPELHRPKLSDRGLEGQLYSLSCRSQRGYLKPINDRSVQAKMACQSDFGCGFFACLRTYYSIWLIYAFVVLPCLLA